MNNYNTVQLVEQLQYSTIGATIDLIVGVLVQPKVPPINGSMSDKLANTVPEEGLRRFAESCVLSPSILARRLKLKENEIEQIKYAYPHDRYEQIYQVLLKWSQVNTVVTWKDLIDATDSGIKRVLEDLYDKQDDIDNIDTEEYIPKRPHVDDSEGPIPTAPPFCDVFIPSSINKDYGPFSEVDDTILTCE